jgi:DNA-binding NarL/FixJ family response regulator
MLKALRYVIVDDNRGLLESASSLLESQGMSVVGVATTMREAVPMVEKLRPDVILVDIVLGTESGFELVRRVAAPSAAGCRRTILMSTRNEEDFGDLIAASPAIGFLRKDDMSVAAIRRLLVHAEPRSP